LHTRGIISTPGKVVETGAAPVSGCDRAPGLVVDPAAVVVEHRGGGADAGARVDALAHAVLDAVDFVLGNGVRVPGSVRVRGHEGHVDEGHVLVQHKQLGQPGRVEELEVGGPASKQRWCSMHRCPCLVGCEAGTTAQKCAGAPSYKLQSNLSLKLQRNELRQVQQRLMPPEDGGLSQVQRCGLRGACAFAAVGASPWHPCRQRRLTTGGGDAPDGLPRTEVLCP